MAIAQFDPGQRLSKVKGQDYLEVKWRIAWLRSEHADATLQTDLHTLTDSRAIFRAEINIPGGGTATGWGSETADNFENFIEKAETKAIGRALAALGFGTPYTNDFDEGFPSEQQQPRRPAHGAQSELLMSGAQKGKILHLSRELEMPTDALNELCRSHTGQDFLALTKRQASGVIDALAARSGAARPAVNAS